VRTHCENYRWIQWKYPGHRLSSKTLITLWSKDPAKPIYTYSVKGNFHNKELHLATFCNFPGTGQVIPNNQQRTELCRWHWGSETPLNIRAVNLGYLQWKQSLHHPATKLCTTWNRHWNRRHVRHCQYGNYDSNSTGWWQPCYHLWPNLPTTAQSQEENMDQEWDWEKVSYWSTGSIPKPLHWHFVQAPSCHQHEQIQFVSSQEFHPQDNNPIYRKQFNLPETHNQFIEQTLDEWLKLGVVRRTNSPYNLPIFCVPKKQGQGLRIMQDFWQLNQHLHIDKYFMKEIN
jgi:hypothetical protein